MDRRLDEPFDRKKWYAVDGERMERVRKLVLRLYSENRWKPGEMRDTAQQLEWVVFDAVDGTDTL